MSVTWLTPIAAVGLLAVGVPLLIHLLTNQQTRQVTFPSLRFIHPTRLAALRRRWLQDGLLLLVRMLILAAAVAALASPVFVSDARKEQWRQRVARAIVVAPGTEATTVAPVVDSERRDTFASEVFRPALRVADGLREAALWLQKQPPATREVVVAGHLPLGSIVEADLVPLPPHAGIRFLPLPAPSPAGDLDLRFQEGDTLWRARTSLHESSTRVSYERAGATAGRIQVRAAAEEQAVAEAALAVAAARGLDVDQETSRRVVVVFDGGASEDLTLTKPAPQPWMRDALSALSGMTGGASGDILVIQVRTRATPAEAARVLDRVVRAAFRPDRGRYESAPIPVQRVAQWSRSAGPPTDVLPGDEGDRRWFWGAALALLALETLIRRHTRTSAANEVEEARVA